MTFDWNASVEDMRAIRADNEEQIAIRRADSTLSAQAMRVEIAGMRAQRMMSDAARQSSQALFILGEPDMDIAVEDRFNWNGYLIRVVFIQPNRLACTIAEGVVVK